MTDLVSDIQQAARSAGIGRAARSSVFPFVALGLAAAAIGAVFAWVLDPQLGRTRRAVTKDRVAGGARQIGRWSAQRGRSLASGAAALTARMQPRTNTADVALDEVDLANRVKSEVFRDPEVDKGDIVVNVERDVVFLRGTAPSREQIERVGHLTGQIDGIGKVVNLLHIPGEPPPVLDREDEVGRAGWAIPL